MRFLLNANMPQSAADVLERRGHDAVHVRDTALKDAPDERVAAFARTEPEGPRLERSPPRAAPPSRWPNTSACTPIETKPLPQRTAAAATL